ncbi:MAG: hypothetical protein M3O09_17720 [Acidobacteriota bacterium]|nr:hypothetical protein [Acidobacteriota bacterium]
MAVAPSGEICTYSSDWNGAIEFYNVDFIADPDLIYPWWGCSDSSDSSSGGVTATRFA